MCKKYILLCAILGFSTAYANKPVDSIGVENNNGKKLIIHKVDPKESYYSISRKYNVNVKDVQTYNNNASLQIGNIIKVPTDIPFNQKTSVSNSPVINATSFFDYIVAAKDNLNLIAERFATTVAEIKKLNNLSGNNLQVGQVLKVPFVKNGNSNPSTAKTPVIETAAPAATNNLVTEHTVKPKEYLGVIAKQYGITVEELKEANGLTSNNLSIGQVLKIPAKNGLLPGEKVTEVIMMPPPPITDHEVKSPETIFTIAKKYNTTVDYLRQLNDLNSNTLKVGQTIKVPKTENKEKTDNLKANTNSTPIAPATKIDPSFEHVVANGETIYSIAQRYQLTTYQIKTFNNLTSNELTVGQKLIIKGEKPAAVANNDEEETGGNSETLKNPNLKRPAAVYGLNKIEEKGIGVWISDPDLDQTKMLILHRTAPVGTIIQITNPMTNRSTFAKVVGKFTENEATKDAIIVMTKAVADAVGALDKRFFCNLTYGPKENEK